MQAHYDVTKLTFRPSGVPPALPAIEKALDAGASSGRLLGVWTSELGELNQVLIVHALEVAGASLASRDARQRRGDLFGASDQLVTATSSTFASFPFVPEMPTGRFGPVFELREYDVKAGGLPSLLSTWEAALPARIRISPLLLAAYALDGVQPRIMHMWPYPDLNDRGRIRGEAVAQGVWPPKGGAEYLVTMRSSIWLPAPFSPLQ